MSIAASTARRWEHFEHMADMGVRGIGPSREAAFVEAAFAMCAVITDPALVRPEILFEVDCHAPDDEFLLVDWLNALVYQMSGPANDLQQVRGLCLRRPSARAGKAAWPAERTLLG